MTGLLATAGVLLTGVGMMLVVTGVLVAGVFLPGVVLLGLGLLAFAATAVYALVRPQPAGSVPPG